MPLPTGWSLIPVTGEYENLDASLQQGYVIVSTTQILESAGVAVFPSLFTFLLAADCSVSGTLPALAGSTIRRFFVS